MENHTPIWAHLLFFVTGIGLLMFLGSCGLRSTGEKISMHSCNENMIGIEVIRAEF